MPEKYSPEKYPNSNSFILKQKSIHQKSIQQRNIHKKCIQPNSSILRQKSIHQKSIQQKSIHKKSQYFTSPTQHLDQLHKQHRLCPRSLVSHQSFNGKWRICKKKWDRSADVLFKNPILKGFWQVGFSQRLVELNANSAVPFELQLCPLLFNLFRTR